MTEKYMCAIFGENQDELEFGYDEDHYICAQMKLRLVCAIKQLCEDGCRSFVSTLEQGAAMWGGEACTAIKSLGGNIEFTAAPTEDEQASRWHPERRERYFDLLERADILIQPTEDSFGEDYIFEHAGRMIVLGDARHPRLACLIERAASCGIDVINV